MATVQHIGFVCRDRLAMERFYAKYFGLRRVHVFEKGEPTEFAMMRLGDVCLEFFQADEEELRAEVPKVRAGFKHLCFEVPKLEPKIAELEADGIEVGKIIDCSHEIQGQRICFLNDPDGNSVRLIAWPDSSPNHPATSEGEQP